MPGLSGKTPLDVTSSQTTPYSRKTETEQKDVDSAKIWPALDNLDLK